MEMKSVNRRTFIQCATVGLAGLGLSCQSPKNQDQPVGVKGNEADPKIKFNLNDIILFQGDSITDASRNRDETDPNKGALGHGYVHFIGAYLLQKFADKQLQIINKGISGDKVYQMSDRWDTDCIQLKPNIFSILVGVNDFWHTIDFKYKGTVETYATDLNRLIERTKSLNCQMIIGEPFILKTGAVNDAWYPHFAEYQKAAATIAEKQNALFIPYQSVFDNALQLAPANYWLNDGVHPTLAGAQLMADAWLRYTGIKS